MRIKATFELPSFDKAAYNRQLSEVMTAALQEGARVWLRAAINLIPVWSGESQGTFEPLARAVGMPLLIRPAATARNFPRRRNASRDTGEIDAGRGARGVFSFEYGTDLAHLVYNEFNNANVNPDPSLFSQLRTPGPYLFQLKAGADFRNYASSVRLPNPLPFIKRTILRVG